MLWGSDGEVQIELTGRGIEATEVKPLYAMEPYTGEALVMMEAGSPSAFYLYNRIEGNLYRITGPDDLTEIVECINDEGRGLSGLDLEELQ